MASSDEEETIDSSGQESILFHDGSVFCFYVEDTTLHAYCLHVSARHGGKLSKKQSCQLSAGTGCRLRLVSVASCRDWKSGQQLPVALLEATVDGSLVYYTVVLEVKSSKVKKARLLATRKVSLEGPFPAPPHIQLLPGPSLAWTINSTIHASMPEELSPASVALQEHFKTTITEAEILAAGCVCRTLVLIGTCLVVESTSTDSALKFFILEVVNTLHSETVHRFLDVEDYLPKEYAEAVTGLRVVEWTRKKEGYNSLLFLCVSEGYVVALRNGQMVGCVSTTTGPMQHLCERLTFRGVLQSVTLGEVAVVQVGKQVCAVVPGAKGKVLERWSSVQQVAVGDMLQMGRDQVLLLLSGFDITAASGPWLLTDLGSYCLNHSGGAIPETFTSAEELGESSRTAAAALQRNLTLLTGRVAEKERSVQLKEEFIKCTLQNLEAMTQFQDTFHEPKIPKVPLCEGFQREESVSRKNTGSPVIQVGEHWQRVVASDWVVGVAVTNMSDLPISQASLFLVPCRNEPCSTRLVSTAKQQNQQSQQCQEDLQWCHLQAKRPKLDTAARGGHSLTSNLQIAPGQTVSVTCSCPLPQFSGKAQVSAQVFCCVQWTTSSADSAAADSRRAGTKDQEKRSSIYCGTVSLSPQHLLSQSLQLNLHPGISSKELKIALATLTTVQTDHPMIVTSPFGGLGGLGGWLTQRAGFLYLEPLSAYVRQELPALALVRLTLTGQGSRSQTGVVLSVRDEAQLSLLLHHLQTRLPDGITFTPRPPDLRAARQQCFASLQHEISAATHSISMLLQQHQQQGKVDEIGSVVVESAGDANMDVDVASTTVIGSSSQIKEIKFPVGLNAEAVERLRKAMQRQKDAVKALQKDAVLQTEASDLLAHLQCQRLTDSLMAASLDE